MRRLTAAQVALLSRVKKEGPLEVRGAMMRPAEALSHHGLACLVARDPEGSITVPFTVAGWHWSLELRVEVKLSAGERAALAVKTRKHLRVGGHEPGYGIEEATCFLESEIDALGRFDTVPMEEITDYAVGFARFICHAEARSCL